MKTQKEFAEDILNQITSNTEYTGEIVEKVLNNGEVIVGIAIIKPGSMMGPMIKLNDFYEAYRCTQNEQCISMTIQDIKNMVYTAWEQETDVLKIGNEIKMGFQAIKDRITMRLVNAEKNQQRLKNIPWIPFLDLAVTFFLEFIEEDGELRSIEVDHGLMEKWNVTSQDLYQVALGNMEKKNDGLFCSLSEYMENILGLSLAEENPEGKFHLYIMTNKKSAYGAVEILRPGELERRAQKIGRDLIVLPSSVHETLILPYTAGLDIEGLRMLVRRTNADTVIREEQLSDQIYLYRRDKDALMIA